MCSEVVGQTGFLVLGLDGAVLSSGGDLQADQRTAATLHQLVLTADQGNLGTTRITVTYADHAYVLSLADKRIHVVKKTVGSSEALV